MYVKCYFLIYNYSILQYATVEQLEQRILRVSKSFHAGHNIYMNVYYLLIMYTDKLWKRFCDRISQPAVSASLKSLQGTCPTVMLTLCQLCHDATTTCITRMICVQGYIVYVTWGTIIVNTMDVVTTWVVGAHQRVMGALPTEVGVHFLDIPVSVGCET